MDSEHRHELKESDLATAIATAKDWWGKHQMKVLTTAVIVAALILAIRFFSANAHNARQNEQYQLATAIGPDDLRKIADATGNESVKVQASLRGGDAILTQLRKPATGADALTEAKKKELLEVGESMYRAALEESKHPLVRIKANFGLAALAETRGEWAKAAEFYKTIQKEGGEGNEFLTKRAAAFEAALPRVQANLLYGREETPKKTPFEFGSDPTKDKSLNPGGFNLLPGEKDGKEKDVKAVTPDPAKDAKSPLLPPLVPSPDKEPVVPAPEKDGKEKDAKSPVVPPVVPAPEKDAKPAPEKDAKAPTP